MQSDKSCPHELTTRDMSNVGTCVACGENMGIGYAAWEYPPTGEYWGIDRSSFTPVLKAPLTESYQ